MESRKNQPLLLKTLLHQETNEIPVWLMRQAGRYLPEYRALKETHTFLELSEDPDLASEVTIQPLKRFSDLDAAILFADILTPARSLGFDFEFSPGPIIRNPISSTKDVSILKTASARQAVPYVFEALSKVRDYVQNEDREGDKPRRAVLGFAACPWTLACYLVDQGVYKHHLGTKIFAKKHPEAFIALCEQITEITIEYLIEKHEAGADAVQLFDTWANLLSPHEYHPFSGTFTEQIIKALNQKNIPCILYIQASSDIVLQASTYGSTALSVDWKAPFAALRNTIPETQCLQGNFDPTSLFYNEDAVFQLALNTYRPLKGKNIIANLGHGVLQQTPIENVAAFIRGVKSA